ncbi:hypothetical protein ACER0A_001990 [Haloimpatiens sp. FM7315]|uniref:hypothetical protein n=1 Tax=Haloimpatiens sp. FM7315 TaxID=3298609 RepID=UPI00370C0897
MERKNGFITFLTALVPGVGYMYFGLMNKGIEALLVFFLIEPIFNLVGLHFLGNILQLVIWCYTFFDTFSIARKIEKGEYVEDKTHFADNSFKINVNNDFKTKFQGISRNKMVIIAWAFIIIGILAVVNRVFQGSDIYYLVKSSISAYFLPVLFILGGMYILFRK